MMKKVFYILLAAVVLLTPAFDCQAAPKKGKKRTTSAASRKTSSGSSTKSLLKQLLDHFNNTDNGSFESTSKWMDGYITKLATAYDSQHPGNASSRYAKAAAMADRIDNILEKDAERASTTVEMNEVAWEMRQVACFSFFNSYWHLMEACKTDVEKTAATKLAAGWEDNFRQPIMKFLYDYGLAENGGGSFYTVIAIDNEIQVITDAASLLDNYAKLMWGSSVEPGTSGTPAEAKAALFSFYDNGINAMADYAIDFMLSGAKESYAGMKSAVDSWTDTNMAFISGTIPAAARHTAQCLLADFLLGLEITDE